MFTIAILLIAKIKKRPSLAALSFLTIVLIAKVKKRPSMAALFNSLKQKWALGPFHSPPLYRVQTPATRNPCAEKIKAQNGAPFFLFLVAGAGFEPATFGL
jgi:hypothetical protein